jgi:hypothetical protein
VSGYFIRERDGKFYIVARYDDGTEETHLEGLARADAELQMLLATGEIVYEKKQLDLGL